MAAQLAGLRNSPARESTVTLKEEEHRKPDEGKPHVRFDAGGAGKVKGGLAPSDEISVLYSTPGASQTDAGERRMEHPTHAGTLRMASWPSL
ncbi:hypothetical protein [Paenibacillus validus]|uniref:hypothetical protein n=1 Tax=Paenibacillus validus TaxID=44253 RepID=UPI003D2A6CD2